MDLGSVVSVVEHELHFVIEGEFITDIARQMWGIEGNPDKGLSVLQSAFPSMPVEIMFAVLMGYKKLTGDSDIGIAVEEDDQACEELTLASSINKYRDTISKLEDRLQMAEGATEFLSSPHGLIEVPRRQTELVERKGGIGTMRALRGDWDLLDRIPWRTVTEKRREAKHFSADTELRRAEAIQDYEPLAPRIPAPPPPGKKKIDADEENGWLAPDGTFFACFYGDHISLADRLGYDTPGVIEKLKWVKIQRGDAFSVHLEMDKDLSQAQINVLFDWYVAKGGPMPWWLRPDKEDGPSDEDLKNM
jgi:hypothetical protein